MSDKWFCEVCGDNNGDHCVAVHRLRAELESWKKLESVVTRQRDEAREASRFHLDNATSAANGTDGDCLCDYVIEGPCQSCRHFTERNEARRERDRWKRLAGGHCETCMDQSCVRLKEEKYSDALAKIKGKP